MLGRVSPVRLSGPGIPPRLIALLMDHSPCPIRIGPFRLAAFAYPFALLGSLIVGLLHIRRVSHLRMNWIRLASGGFQEWVIVLDRLSGLVHWFATGKVRFGSRTICLCPPTEAIVMDQWGSASIRLPELH